MAFIFIKPESHAAAASLAVGRPAATVFLGGVIRIQEHVIHYATIEKECPSYFLISAATRSKICFFGGGFVLP
jgi:hypothetical protein